VTRDAGSTCQCDNSDDKLRVAIYREAWRDAAVENAELREENKKQHSRIAELEDTLVRLQQDAMQRRNENLSMRETIQQSEQRIKELEERNRNQFLMIQDLRKDRRELEERNRNQFVMIQDLRKDRRELENAVDLRFNENKKLNEDNSLLREKATNLEDQLTMVQGFYKNLEEKTLKLVKRLDDAKSILYPVF
jgi:predicted nuclease with TOPRIM domain